MVNLTPAHILRLDALRGIQQPEGAALALLIPATGTGATHGWSVTATLTKGWNLFNSNRANTPDTVEVAVEDETTARKLDTVTAFQIDGKTFAIDAVKRPASDWVKLWTFDVRRTADAAIA